MQYAKTDTKRVFEGGTESLEVDALMPKSTSRQPIEGLTTGDYTHVIYPNSTQTLNNHAQNAFISHIDNVATWIMHFVRVIDACYRNKSRFPIHNL